MSDAMQTALTVRGPSPLVRPVAKPADIIEAHKEIAALIGQALESGIDYGVTPGAGDKPTLLKPGAERLALAFGAAPQYVIVEKEIDHDREVEYRTRKKKWGKKRGEMLGWEEERGTSLGLYRYVIRCQLVRRGDDVIIADGLGSASTMETKYVRAPRDAENTVLKMACKRSFVASVLNGFGLSNRFTQDIEDRPDEGDGQDPPSRPPAPTEPSRETAHPGQRRELERWATSPDISEAQRDWLIDVLAKPLSQERAKTVLERLLAKGGAAVRDAAVDTDDNDPGEPPAQE